MDLFFKDFFEESQDMSLAAARMIAAAKSGDILHLGGGVYHFHPENASKDEFYISNNDGGVKSIAFYFNRKENITLDGEGAELIFHNKITPFAVNESENIVIKNLSVDYQYPKYAQGKILQKGENAGESYLDLEFTGEFHARLKNNMFCFYSPEDGWENVENPLVTEFCADSRAPAPYTPYYFPVVGEIDKSNFLSVIMRNVTLTQISDTVIRMQGDLPKEHKVGNYLVATHGGRENPAIFLNETKDTFLKDIKIYHSIGMGIVGQLSENISLENIVVAPRENSGRMLSANHDSSHFVNCTGLIKLENCRFVSLMDDCCNIHGNYLRCRKVLSSNSLELTFGHRQQKGVLVYKPGDRVRLLPEDEIIHSGEFTVQSASLKDADTVILTLEENLPACTKPGDLVENYSRMPAVHISNCDFGDNRPRGLLLATNKKSVVENCTFHSMYQGIHIGSEIKNWLESGSVEDVLIQNNNFTNAAYVGDYAITVRPKLIKPTSEPFHKNIVIKNNTFTMNDRRFLQAVNTRGLVFKDNVFVKDTSLPSHGDKENGIMTENLVDSEIEEPVC